MPAANATKKKKRKTLPTELEKVYLAALPTAQRYSKSLMHRDQLAFVTMTPITDFLITTSVDGVVKFWKKMADGIEFVKMFRAHQGEIVSVSVSSDGRSFASAGTDRKIVIFDVVTFGKFCTRMKNDEAGANSEQIYWLRYPLSTHLEPFAGSTAVDPLSPCWPFLIPSTPLFHFTMAGAKTTPLYTFSASSTEA